MDLWAWVNDTERRLRKEGHGRLADLIDRLPTEVCNDRHDRVDAIVPEALALAKSLDLGWIEVFLKHWWLQSRVLHRMDGRALGDAVALVELAHRDETRACPQGVCAVQDLASCYGFVDGPGYAEERLAVAKETLERIDASWPCFTCISSEYASALRDRGDVKQSLEFVDRQIATLIARGQRDALYDFPRDRIEVLIDLGRVEEALAFADEVARRGRKDAHHDLSRRLDRARILARLGRADDALQSLPTIDEVRPTPLFYWFWADAAEQLVRLGVAPNDAQLGRILQSFIDRLERQGVGRTTLELADLHGRLAIERGAPHVARRALSAMDRALKLLAKPLDALDRAHKLRAAIAAAPGLDSIELPETAEATLVQIREGEGRDPEHDLLVLEAARARFSSDVPLALALAGCQLANGLEAEAIDSLEAFHQRENHDDVALRLGDLLIGRDGARLRALVDRHRARADTDESRSISDWLLARAAFSAREYEACRRHLDGVLAARPDAVNSRMLWADAARRVGDLSGALEKLDEVVARVPEGGPHDWERMVVATLLGDWTRVRASAARVGFEVEGEGPIDEKWGVCRIRFDDEGRDAWAVRTGPVTARVVEVARPPRPQRFHDVVVFDATPLNPPSDDAEEKQAFIYPWVATLSEAGYRAYELDGLHPGDEMVEAIRKAMAEIDCELQVLSAAEYVVERDGEDLPGLFAVVALPRERTPKEVCAKLAASVGEHPLAFVELARAAGDGDLAQKHLAIVDDYGL